MRTKICIICKQPFPADTENFGRDKSRKDGLSPRCKECNRRYCIELHRKSRDSRTAKMRERYAGLSEEKRQAINAEKRLYHDRNKQRDNQRAQQNYKLHREERKKSGRRYYEAHKTRLAEYGQRWRQKNHDKLMRDKREWKRLHPERIKIWTHKRRAIKRAAEGAGLPFDEAAQLKRQHGKCYYCQCELDHYHIEHVIPLSRGGSDHPDNKVLACPHCNMSKHDKLPHEWLKGGRLL